MKKILILLFLLPMMAFGQCWQPHGAHGVIYSDPTLPHQVLVTPTRITAGDDVERMDITLYDSIGRVVVHEPDIASNPGICGDIYAFNRDCDGEFRITIYHYPEYDRHHLYCYTVAIPTKRREEKIIHFWAY